MAGVVDHVGADGVEEVAGRGFEVVEGGVGEAVFGDAREIGGVGTEKSDDHDERGGGGGEGGEEEAVIAGGIQSRDRKGATVRELGACRSLTVAALIVMSIFVCD